MLNLLNKSDQYLKGLVLSRSPDLWTKRKGNRLLIVNGNLGSWVILDEQFQEFFKKLQKPILYPDFIANDEGIPPAMYIAFMEKLYSKGMLLLSGKLPEFSGAAKIHVSVSPKLYYLNFTGDNQESYDYFTELIKKRFQMEKSGRYDFHLQGKFSLSDDRFNDFIDNVVKRAKESGKDVSFNVEMNSLNEIIPENISDFPLILEYTVKILPGFFADNDKVSMLKKLLSGMAKLQKKCIKTGLIASLYEPESILPLINECMENDISNIALKISPETYLSDIPLVKSIRLMEAFGSEYLKMLDFILPDLLYGNKQIVLRDIHRFLFRLTGYDTPYPCGFPSCGMGEQVIFADDRENFYACRYMEKSRESLSLNISDINCPSESEKLRFWKSNTSGESTQCRRCPWKHFCGGGCPVLTYEKYGVLNREDPRCRFFRVMYENLIWKFYDSPLIVRKLGGLI